MPAFRVFLSAVSSEFGSARDALGASLRSRDMLIRTQSDFRQEADSDTTLRKLHDYIRDCSAVVCIIGKRSGAMPSAAAAAPFASLLPPRITEASYTQWEFWFARHYKRRLSIYIATDAWAPDKRTPAGERPDLQDALLRTIVEEQDLDRDYFGDLHHLCHLVLKEDWPRERPVKPIMLPYPSLGTLFKGRNPFMRRLRTSLTRTDGGTAAIAGRAVHGLGGVGKTRAAVEYAWAYRADYTALALLDSETPEKLHASLAALVSPLRLPEQASAEDKVKIEAVLAWLNATPGWLLILDNIDTESALNAANRLLGRLQGGHVVLTSRLSAGFPRGVEPLDMDVLSLDDAASFLLEATETGRRKAADDAAHARMLAEELGQLALALEMTAATIEARSLGFAGYRALWQGNRARVVGWADQKITGYHHAVAETWRTSVDQLTESGRRLLELLAFLAPDPVPEFLLAILVSDVEGEDATAALDDLTTYSLATRVEGGETFLVHRLVQDVTRRGLVQSGAMEERLTEAVGWVNAAFSGHPEDVRNWGRLDPLAPHADAVAARADVAGISDPTGQLLHHLSGLFQSKALYARAEPLMRRALAIGESSFGKEHPNVASALNNLATLLQSTNRLGEAEMLLRRALAIDETSLGRQHPRVATALSNLAELLQNTNRVAEAEELMRRALEIDEATHGKDHPAVASDLNNLAGLLHASNRLAEAEPLLRRALTIYEACRDGEHPDVANVLNSLGRLLQDTNRHRQAEPLLRRALSIYEASLGQNHPTVAIALNNVAVLLHATNRFSEAEPLMRRALNIDETNLGRYHPNVARDLNGLAMLLQVTNRLDEAWPLVVRALAIDEASFGNDHPNVAIRLNSVAALLRATNRFSEAEPLMRRALAVDEASLGKNHPDVARDLSNLATLLIDTDRPGQAEALIRRALAIFLVFQRDTGHAHPHRDLVIGIYARLLAAMGKSEADIAASIADVAREAGLDQA